jgi:serine/threonine protein kinase
MRPLSADPEVIRAEKSSYLLVQEHTLIGKNLSNRYRILREIGSGGMAWVYLAEDTTDQSLIAVKVLYPQFGEDLSYIQRFNREAKLASALTDPHIVRVLDYGADRDVHYLVMEYIEGQNLRDTLEEKGTFPWKHALEVIDQLATALEHAHLLGIVHRDIKPQNMMLTESGLLKVLDFGIARIPTLPSLTQSGFIGSPYYVSPEQAMGEEVDTRADIYSAGIVLYELLSGKIPFDAKSPWSIINQHISVDLPPIKLPNGEIPEEVQELLNRMVAKRPEERFPNPAALRRAIAAVLAGQPIPDSALDTQPITPPDKEAMAESLYQRALKSMEAQEWGRAVDLLNQSLSLAPNHAEASKTLSIAEQKTFLTSLFNAGKRAIKNERWEEAINSLNGIVELDPDCEEAKTLLTQARTALEEENAKQFVATRYNEGIAHFEAGRWQHAIEAFQEVQQLAPGYQRVEQLLVEAERLAYPNLFQKLVQIISTNEAWRWALIASGVVAIILIAFFTIGNGTPSVADNDIKQQLKTLYEEAKLAIDNGNSEQAVVLLDQILQEDPDYADAAELKRELILKPTPIPEEDPLQAILEQAQKAVDIGQWTEAIQAINEVRAANPDYEQARVNSLLCDASVGRGMEIIANIVPEDDEKDLISAALADFEAGTAECPRRIDLRDQAERATAYLEAIDTSTTEYDTLIQLLTPIVAVEPSYAGNNAKNRLYAAYLSRAAARGAAGDVVLALSDYEAALALGIADPSEAQNRRAELLLAFAQDAETSRPTPEPLPLPTLSAIATQEPTIAAQESTPVVIASRQPEKVEETPEPVRIRLGPPKLTSPVNDAVFAGKFTEVFVEWEPVRQLAADEYYDLTVMHIFADEPQYWGLATRETRIQLNEDIGLGNAGGDRFYWWVTVRKANTAPPDSIDLPVSRQSEGRTFIWSP